MWREYELQDFEAWNFIESTFTSSLLPFIQNAILHLYKTTPILYFDTLNDTLQTVQQMGVKYEQNCSEL